jgi:hypothetical protein
MNLQIARSALAEMKTNWKSARAALINTHMELPPIYKSDLLQVDLGYCTPCEFVENPDGTISWYTYECS